MDGQSKIAALLLSALVVVGLCGSAAAQAYPARAVTIITPSLPGGGIDITARQIAAELQNALGEPFVVENRAGASGNIATLDVARATPDGYTLLLTISGFQVTNPALFQSLPWDPVRDFAAVAMISRSYHVLVVNKDFPANTLSELIAYARANPGKLNYGSPGVGTQTNIASEQLAQMADIMVTAVPYRATGPAFTDLLGGTLRFFINTTQQLIGPLQGHAIKARHPEPDAPSAAARPADHRRSRPARFADRHLVCALRAGRNAARHRRSARPRDQANHRARRLQSARRRERRDDLLHGA